MGRAGVTAVAASVVLLATALGGGSAAPVGPSLLSSGVAGSGGVHGHRTTVGPDVAAAFVPGTSVLGPDRNGVAVAVATFPSAVHVGDLALEIAAQRAWLAAGRVPGRSPLEREVATRALLDLALLTSPDGAAVAAPFGAWDLVWPRDASWYVAAFAATGHPDSALSVLRFLARVQAVDGTWAARYRPSGDPVDDGRPRQLDAVGWAPWAVWSWWQSSGDRAVLRELWPMIAGAAEAALDAIRADGLPRPSADYTEQPQSRPTLGIAAPLLLGLRSAADLADALGDEPARRRWSAAARRLDTAIGATFGRTGYRRHPDGGAGPDCAIAFLRAPLAPPTDKSGVRRALANDEHELLMASGGLRPGDMPHVRDTAWTTSTALFALADSGDDHAFQHWFAWLVAHRTGLGELPEKVSPDGRPASVAPLGWTDAILLLALAYRDGLVATPPVPRP